MTNRFLALAGFIATIPFSAFASPMACSTAPLTTYTNGGEPFLCSESGGIQIGFNQNVLPSYVGLNLLSTNNGAADPANITTTPGASSLTFTSSTFTESSALLSSQAELVQFNVYDSTSFNSTTFQLENPSVSAGALGLGVAAIVGQELVCVGGNFTSLPVGLVTSVTNGLLGTGEFGCNGAVLVGTAADDIGLLSDITGLVGLPNLTGLTDSATIQLSPYNVSNLDVIKIQALVTTTGGSASTSGFGDSFSSAATATPEPDSAIILMLGLIGVAGARVISAKKGGVR